MRFSRAVVASGLAPAAFKTSEQVFVAIQYGAEIGLSPMQSLNSIAVINQRPSLWGDALVALVRKSGKCDFIQETFRGEFDKDDFTAVCRVGREGQEVERSFSVADAKAANLWSKSIWKNYPKRMLAVRARAWALRDAFADVLCGFQCAEEQYDIGSEPEARKVIDNPTFRALSSALNGKAGCQNDNDRNAVVRWATAGDFTSLDAISGNEDACGTVLERCKAHGWDSVLSDALPVE